VKDKTKPPDFLAIGHVTMDLRPEGGYRLGGTAAFSALTAQRLGVEVALVTSISADFTLGGELVGMGVSVLPAPATTTFRNLYPEGERSQWMLDRALPIGAGAIPPAWRGADIVLLGPVAGEIEPGISTLFSPSSLVALSPQGLWRHWDEAGKVTAIPQMLHPDWQIQVLVLSGEDIGEEAGVLEGLIERVPICVVTEGDRGATLYQAGVRRHFPPRPTSVCDPTGAGDVFAAAFLVKWRETGDAGEAMAFATSAASLAIEAPGLGGIPSRRDIERTLEGYRV
jgi:sugar/nucleoside kinase (ribokinase family)